MQCTQWLGDTGWSGILWDKLRGEEEKINFSPQNPAGIVIQPFINLETIIRQNYIESYWRIAKQRLENISWVTHLPSSPMLIPSGFHLPSDIYKHLNSFNDDESTTLEPQSVPLLNCSVNSFFHLTALIYYCFNILF